MEEKNKTYPGILSHLFEFKTSQRPERDYSRGPEQNHSRGWMWIGDYLQLWRHAWQWRHILRLPRSCGLKNWRQTHQRENGEHLWCSLDILFAIFFLWRVHMFSLGRAAQNEKKKITLLVSEQCGITTTQGTTEATCTKPWIALLMWISLC